MATFTERLKELRKKNKLTQEELAKALGISRDVYANWENGRAKPDFLQLSNIADYFDTSIDYLVGRVDKECADIGLQDFIRKSRSLGYVVCVTKANPSQVRDGEFVMKRIVRSD
ncbi:helix-turn-helix transcriptional regulator [Enterococcus faecalis]|uniref:helix-turn-helix domain-containing protein n=1 Tax=Enterococcus faecalis TaxID=1351 RepID=UPI0027E9D1B4|nr:helix-turn-helix transcriptional regulator [Enterococcus faecalis]EKZ0111327.1 helix-turn-helix transcriptional regulator [Enterococcus faecalis]